MNNPKAFLLVVGVYLAVCGTVLAGGVPDPNLYPDLNGDKTVNFADFALMANNWLHTGVGLAGDFDDSN
jgi:hypothetical protein